MKKDEYENLLKKKLCDSGVYVREVENTFQKQLPRLNDNLFLTFRRSHSRPDFLIEIPDKGTFPCEAKSPQEMYGACHFSRAHVACYLQQIIYGQCPSYADLYRFKEQSRLLLYLFLPKKIDSIGDIEDIFRAVLNQPKAAPAEVMELTAAFSAPSFADAGSEYYGIINTSKSGVLCTLIEYRITEQNELENDVK